MGELGTNWFGVGGCADVAAKAFEVFFLCNKCSFELLLFWVVSFCGGRFSSLHMDLVEGVGCAFDN